MPKLPLHLTFPYQACRHIESAIQLCETLGPRYILPSWRTLRGWTCRCVAMIAISTRSRRGCVLPAKPGGALDAPRSCRLCHATLSRRQTPTHVSPVRFAGGLWMAASCPSRTTSEMRACFRVGTSRLGPVRSGTVRFLRCRHGTETHRNMARWLCIFKPTEKQARIALTKRQLKEGGTSSSH